MSGRDRPTKKFGSNLNRITRAPTAPPVLPGSGAATSSFRVGSSSSRNGLLLLSTKAKSEPSAKLAPGVAAVTGKLRESLFSSASECELNGVAALLPPPGRPLSI